jgi:hypothetical protein
MTKVEMTALDSLHASAATPANMVAGDKFTINSDEAAQLEKRGLAKSMTAKASEAPERVQRTKAPRAKTTSTSASRK